MMRFHDKWQITKMIFFGHQYHQTKLFYVKQQHHNGERGTSRISLSKIYILILNSHFGAILFIFGDCMMVILDVKIRITLLLNVFPNRNDANIDGNNH